MTDATTAEQSRRVHEHVHAEDAEAVNRADARTSLYAKRKKIFPKRVFGTFRKIKWAVLIATLGVYYLAPWIRWDRGPNAPDQAILINLADRRFYFFFIEIWPQEFYYVTGLLIMAALGLFLATSMAGRVWCGYACPQTVWTDLFMQIERWVEGDRGARIRLDNGPWTGAKVLKRSVKHGLWLVVAVLTGGAWVFYFADAPTLAWQLLTFDAPQIAYTTIAVLTFTTYSLGGLMREQVCIYMCPWPRIQGAMLDEESLIVSYREDRGEPRGPHKRDEPWDGRGDCIDCNNCVAVCPTGIDIRDGQQLECITCALCIDACDDVMDKIGRPRGLIAYDTLANDDRRARGEAPKLRVIRPRTVLYFCVWAGVGLAMLTVLALRSDLDINVLRDRNPLYVKLSDGSIRNGYTFKILNKRYEDRVFDLEILGLPGAVMSVVGAERAGEVPVFAAEPNTLASYKIYVAAPPGTLTETAADITFVLTDRATGESARYGSVLRGPGR